MQRTTRTEILGRHGAVVASGVGTVGDVLVQAVADRKNLTGARLAGVDVCNRNLAGAFLGGADLTGARLSGAVLDIADLRGARLVEAVMDRASIAGVQFCEADLSGAVLDEVSGARPTFLRANLEQASLVGAHVPEAVFVESLLADVRMAEITAPRSAFRDAFAERASMAGGDFSNASFHGANLYRACLRSATVDGASFAGARLIAADLHGVDLSKADTRGAVFGKPAFVADVRREVEALIAAGRFQDALDRLETVDSSVRRSPLHAFLAGGACEGLGDLAGAARWYTRAERAAGDDPRPVRELARVLALSGRFEEAAEAYAREAQRSPSSWLSHARAAGARRLEARRASRQPTASVVEQPQQPAAPTPPCAPWPMRMLERRDETTGQVCTIVQIARQYVPDEAFALLRAEVHRLGGRHGRLADERGFLLAPEAAASFVERFGILVDQNTGTPRQRVAAYLEAASRVRAPLDDDATAALAEVGRVVGLWLDTKSSEAQRDPLRALDAPRIIAAACIEDVETHAAVIRAGLQSVVQGRAGDALTIPF